MTGLIFLLTLAGFLVAFAWVMDRWEKRTPPKQRPRGPWGVS